MAGDHVVIDFLRHTSRPLLFSTSLSPVHAVAALEALRIIQREPGLIKRLWTNTLRIRSKLASLGFDIGQGNAPLVPIIIGEEATVYGMVLALEEAGIIVDGVGPPGVKKCQSRIRIRLMATHSDEDLDYALEELGRIGKKFAVI